ncbi:MAG: enoyl-CoA hydratase/isomerase family protein [Massilia sp.]
MEYQTIDIGSGGKLATVTLNRPQVRNAFDEATVAELTHAFARLGQDPEVRVIVLAANGAAFCAGADLHWMRKMAAYSAADNLQDATRLAQMLRTIWECPKPVVARVQGDCYAGGMGLVAACDIVVAAETVKFCLSEVKLGLIPATIAPYVIKAMGASAARRCMVSAEVFDAAEASRIGFVHEVVDGAGLDARVAAIVKTLLANSPQAMAAAKRLVREIDGQPVGDALVADTAQRIAEIRASNEGREGVAAFLEKRKPGWLA